MAQTGVHLYIDRVACSVLLCGLRLLVHLFSVRMQRARPTAVSNSMAPDGSGEAARFAISAPGSEGPSMPI